MSLKSQPIPAVPEETRRVAQAAFPKGNRYMTMRDEFGSIYTDDVFADLYPERGQPAFAPWRLALITVMQFAEGLSDRQAAERVGDSIAWKYALSLELTATGFDASVLSEFRTRLVNGQAEERLLDVMLRRFKDQGLLKTRGKQRTDSTHILMAVRVLNRLECVGETLRHALNTLSRTIPTWLKAFAPKDWYEQYGERFECERLPKTKTAQIAWAERVGADGQALFEAIYNDPGLIAIRASIALQTLRHVWLQNYYTDAEGRLRWRDDANLPPASQRIYTPYDIEARASKKRDTVWLGYKAHMTETCETDYPHLVVHVETTRATDQDHQMVETIHAHLDRKSVLPTTHLVDTGYVDALNIVTSQRHYQVDLVGPAMPDMQWQARQQTGYDLSRFVIDWQRKRAICPQGQVNHYWYETLTRHADPVIAIRFSGKHCNPCPARTSCTRSKGHGRKLYVRPQDEHEALQRRRQEQTTESFKALYKLRAGVEGTFSQAERRCDMRQSRYIGLAKTHLQHVITAAALNLIRVIAWLEKPEFAQTRVSAFAKLAA